MKNCSAFWPTELGTSDSDASRCRWRLLQRRRHLLRLFKCRTMRKKGRSRRLLPTDGELLICKFRGIWWEGKDESYFILEQRNLVVICITWRSSLLFCDSFAAFFVIGVIGGKPQEYLAAIKLDNYSKDVVIFAFYFFLIDDQMTPGGRSR